MKAQVIPFTCTSRWHEVLFHDCIGQLARQTEGSFKSTGSGEIDFERWYVSGLPLALIAACVACQRGVRRAHLVDARVDGALLLELYSRDGVGTMLSADFYEVSPGDNGFQQPPVHVAASHQLGHAACVLVAILALRHVLVIEVLSQCLPLDTASQLQHSFLE